MFDRSAGKHDFVPDPVTLPFAQRALILGDIASLANTDLDSWVIDVE
jgi:hypothetical protein